MAAEGLEQEYHSYRRGWGVFIIYTGYYCYIEVTSFTENQFTFIFMGVISNSPVSWNNAKESSFSLQNILVEFLNNKHI